MWDCILTLEVSVAYAGPIDRKARKEVYIIIYNYIYIYTVSATHTKAEAAVVEQ